LKPSRPSSRQQERFDWPDCGTSWRSWPWRAGKRAWVSTMAFWTSPRARRSSGVEAGAELAEDDAGSTATGDDLDYVRGGTDRLTYRVAALSELPGGQSTVRTTLYYQDIAPHLAAGPLAHRDGHRCGPAALADRIPGHGRDAVGRLETAAGIDRTPRHRPRPLGVGRTRVSGVGCRVRPSNGRVENGA
jgi:hypothetical protein